MENNSNNENFWEQKKALLDLMYKHLHIGIVIYDKSGKMISLNDKGLEIFGFTNFQDGSDIYLYDEPNMPQYVREDLQQGKEVAFELMYDFEWIKQNNYYATSRSGKIFLSVKAVPIFGDKKELVGYLLEFNDITDAKELEKKLQRLDTLAWEYDIATKKSRFLYGRNLTVKHPEILDYKKSIHPDDYKKYHQLILQLAKGNIDKGTIEVRVKHDNENYCTFEHILSSVKNSDGKVIKLIGSICDMSDRIKRQKELEEHNKMNALINNACNIIRWDYDVDKHLIYTYSDDAILPNIGFDLNRYLSFVHPDDREKTKAFFALAHIPNNDVVHVNIRLKVPTSADYINAVLDAVAIRNEEGRIQKYSGIRRDESQWVKINKELQEQINLNQLILYNLNSNVFYFDTDSKLIWSNLDTAREPVKTNRFKNLISGQRCVYWNQGHCNKYNDLCLMQKSINTKSICPLTFQEDGFTYVVLSIPIFGTEKEVIGVLYKINDITEQNRINRELVEAKEKAEQSDKLKSAFLANISHEIRTPLNAIVGFSELLAQTDNPKDKEEYLNIITSNNKLLVNLIGDILDLSKIESGLIELKFKKFDLVSTFYRLFQSFQQKMTNSPVEFLCDNPYAKCIVYMDESRLMQVESNFITNAIKYTPSGHIKMGYNYENEGIRLYVEDTGIGIPKDKHDKVFIRFEKLDSFVQGTGLGLSICKAIAEVTHGKIGFDSKVGKGSTFWAWFPTTAEIEKKET